MCTSKLQHGMKWNILLVIFIRQFRQDSVMNRMKAVSWGIARLLVFSTTTPHNALIHLPSTLGFESNRGSVFVVEGFPRCEFKHSHSDRRVPLGYDMQMR